MLLQFKISRLISTLPHRDSFNTVPKLFQAQIWRGNVNGINQQVSESIVQLYALTVLNHFITEILGGLLHNLDLNKPILSSNEIVSASDFFI